jgi:choline dehydrogenase
MTMTTSGHDYIIIGAGTAGCVIAARLTQHPGTRVLLLEAGTATPAPDPAAWPGLLGTDADWQHVTTPQARAGTLPYPAGKALGGSSAINAMAHIRGHRSVYDQWPPGWRYRDLLPWFRASETARGGRCAPADQPLRGTRGPVRVAPVPPGDRHPVASAFAAALASLGYPATSDLSGRRQHGICWPDLAIAGGQRVSSFDAYLAPVLDRPNLTVRAGAQATRLVIRHGRCTAVTYQQDRAEHTAAANAEVIVCAGAIGTPHLLMRSGIGPAAAVKAAGITPAADLPVGKNLQDHPAVPVTYQAARALRERSRGNHGEMYAAIASPYAGAWPDLHLFPVLLPPPGQQGGYSLLAAVVAPDSRGSVKLNPADPGGPPLIDPGFLKAAMDVHRLNTGLAAIRVAAATAPLAGYGTEISPGPDIRRAADLRRWLRATVGSYWHPVGTCPMGTGPQTVTGTDLKVHGITGLRIADASVIPLIPNAPLNATVLAVAEKAAALITHAPVTPPAPPEHAASGPAARH